MALTDNLSFYYKLDENTGTSVGDSVGTNTGTWQGTLGSQWTTGKINSGGNFNGTDNYISTGTNIPTQSQVFTMAGWVNPTNFTNYMSIMTFNATSGEDFRISTAGKLVFSATGSAVFATSTGTVSAGVFSHVAFTMDSSHNWAYYINGSASGTGNSSHTFDLTHNLYIGQEAGFGSNMLGILDELGYWTRALSSSEITQLYNGGAGLQYPFSIPVTGGSHSPASVQSVANIVNLL